MHPVLFIGIVKTLSYPQIVDLRCSWSAHLWGLSKLCVLALFFQRFLSSCVEAVSLCTLCCVPTRQWVLEEISTAAMVRSIQNVFFLVFGKPRCTSPSLSVVSQCCIWNGFSMYLTWHQPDCVVLDRSVCAVDQASLFWGNVSLHLTPINSRRSWGLDRKRSMRTVRVLWSDCRGARLSQNMFCLTGWRQINSVRPCWLLF